MRTSNPNFVVVPSGTAGYSKDAAQDAERWNSATPVRGRKPTRDSPANPRRTPALAEVIWFGDMCHSLCNSRRESEATPSTHSFESVARRDRKENKYDPQQTHLEIIQAPSVNLRVSRTTLVATSRKHAQMFPALFSRTSRISDPAPVTSAIEPRRNREGSLHPTCSATFFACSLSVRRFAAGRAWLLQRRRRATRLYPRSSAFGSCAAPAI